ncbi:hypothetical protein C2E23DRAFT_439912 [Lenzites betulinus]|nr:hypothetical protein C2E23DRAFT_439912 [Lenzites betulinus]
MFSPPFQATASEHDLLTADMSISIVRGCTENGVRSPLLIRGTRPPLYQRPLPSSLVFYPDTSTTHRHPLFGPAYSPPSIMSDPVTNEVNHGRTILGRSEYDVFVTSNAATGMLPYLSLKEKAQHGQRDTTEQPWIHLFLHQYSGRFASLETLDLENFSWDRALGFWTIGTGFPSITTLTLDNGTFQSFEQFHNVVFACKNLTKLTMTNTKWHVGPTRSLYDATEACPKLEAVWFRNSTFQDAVPALVDWIVKTRLWETVSDVVLFAKRPSDLDKIRELTGTLGTRLTHLQISMNFATPDNFPDLSKNSSLRELSLWDIDKSSCQALCPLLKRLSLAKLRRFKLRLTIPSQDDLNTMETPLKAFANILSTNIRSTNVPSTSAVSTIESDRLEMDVRIDKITPAEIATRVPDLLRPLSMCTGFTLGVSRMPW